MPNHRAGAIANAFVDRFGLGMPQMKLQKLAYIAHGWNLAINGEPLISETPEAWDNGPVFRSIWNAIRDFGTVGTKVVDQNKTEMIAALSPSESSIIDHVWRKYGAYSATDLSRMTHQPNTPWTRAYFTYGRNAPILNPDIENHYRELAFAGRK